MANEWITEYPTQPGAYWIRNYTLTEDPDGHFFGPYIGEVSVIDHKFSLAGSTIARSRLDILSAEWFGPIQPPQDDEDDYKWDDKTGCSFDKSWCSAKATHGDLCDHHWKWEQIYKKRDAIQQSQGVGK